MCNFFLIIEPYSKIVKRNAYLFHLFHNLIFTFYFHFFQTVLVHPGDIPIYSHKVLFQDWKYYDALCSLYIYCLPDVNCKFFLPSLHSEFLLSPYTFPKRHDDILLFCVDVSLICKHPETSHSSVVTKRVAILYAFCPQFKLVFYIFMGINSPGSYYRGLCFWYFSS